MSLPDSLRRGELGSVAKVEAPDAATLVLTLKQPDATLLAQLSDRAGMMLSPKTFGDDVAAVGRKPVCSGRTSSSSASRTTASCWTSSTSITTPRTTPSSA